MDSAWLEKALKLDRNQGINDGKMVDLTLKLGLPISDDACPSTYLGNEDDSTKGKMTVVGTEVKQANLLHLRSSGQVPSTVLLPEIIRTYPRGNSNSIMNSTTGFAMGIIPSHPNYHFNYGFNQPAGGRLFPSSIPNHTCSSIAGYNYTISSNYAFRGEAVPARNYKVGLEIGSASSNHNNSRKRSSPCNDIGATDLGKRCTNATCNASDTPMWRKGPLGPKTLCNACGIKYRKEEDRRKAREAATIKINRPEA